MLCAKLPETQWRDLARMDCLTILAMSAEPELCGAAKVTLTHRRYLMGDDATEAPALEFPKCWQRDELTAATREDTEVIENTLNALCDEDLV